MRPQNYWSRDLDKLAWVGIAMLVGLLCCSCRTVEYVAVEKVKTDSIVVTKVQVDSVYVSENVKVEVKNDTVKITKEKFHYKSKFVHDTLYAERTDSIEVPKIVERKLTRWEQVKMDIGGIGIGMTAIVVLGLVVMLWRRLRKIIK